MTSGCKTTNSEFVFNPDANYLVSRGKGSVELYVRTGPNEFKYYGWVDTDRFVGYSLGYIDWSKNE